MTISDEAVEAAAASFFAGFTRVHPQSKADMRAALEAAAPFIRAEALEEAAQALPFMDRPVTRLIRHVAVVGWLRSRAAEMRQG